jgi:hypothetical protein
MRPGRPRRRLAGERGGDGDEDQPQGRPSPAAGWSYSRKALVALLRHALGRSDRLTRFASLPEALDLDALEDADAVVLDMPRDDATPPSPSFATTTAASWSCSPSRGPPALGRPRPATTLVERSFSAQDLARALNLPASAAPARPLRVAAHDATTAAPLARSRSGRGVGRPGRDGVAERAVPALAALTRGWRTQRRLRVAGFSAFVLVAFAVAFAAEQGGTATTGAPSPGGAGPRPGRRPPPRPS